MGGLGRVPTARRRPRTRRSRPHGPAGDAQPAPIRFARGRRGHETMLCLPPVANPGSTGAVEARIRRCARWSVGVTLGGQVPPAGVDESALPWCLHGAGMVVPADMGDRFTSRHPVEDGQAGQGGSCASDATRAGDLHAFARGARPCFAQCVGGGCAVGGEPEIRPAHPPVLPRHRRWSATRQVHPQAGRGVRRDRAAKSPPAHEPARGKAQDTGRRRLPCGAHGPSVATTCSRGGSNGRRCSIGHGGP